MSDIPFPFNGWLQENRVERRVAEIIVEAEEALEEELNADATRAEQAWNRYIRFEEGFAVLDGAFPFEELRKIADALEKMGQRIIEARR